jgi:PTS system cellobiose-specific IIB component
MKKIMLVCSAGMSTSMLVKKMQDAANERNLEVEIFAAAESEAKRHYETVDVILLGPQVRFMLKKMEQALSIFNTPVEVIDSVSYGTLNGSKVLDQALSIIK